MRPEPVTVVIVLRFVDSCYAPDMRVYIPIGRLLSGHAKGQIFAETVEVELSQSWCMARVEHGCGRSDIIVISH